MVITNSKQASRWAALVLSSSMLGGCMPTYTFERAPLRELATVASREYLTCYRARRLALARGTAQWSASYQQGQYLVTESWGSAGVIFYQGEQRVNAETVLRQLPDAELARAYAGVLAETRGAAGRARWSLPVAVPLLSVGLAATMAGSITVFDGEPDSLTIPLLGGGAAAMLLGLIPLAIYAFAYKPAIQHHLDERMFRHSEWGPRLTGAAAAYNAQIAAQCGMPGAADLPLAQGARSLLGVAPPASPPVAPASPDSVGGPPGAPL
jgi:hypothetical protein